MTGREALKAWIADYFYGEVSDETLEADTAAAIEYLKERDCVVIQVIHTEPAPFQFDAT